MTTSQLQQLKFDLVTGTLGKYTADQIVSTLRLADGQYFSDNTELTLSDSEYDQIVRYVQTTYPTHPWLMKVGSAIRGGKIELPHKLGSLDQLFNQLDLTNWLTSRSLSINDTIVILDKLDGMSGMVGYNQSGQLSIGYSRGDGSFGADITRHLKLLPSIPQVISSTAGMYVRGELIISKLKFTLNQPILKRKGGELYKNGRNAVVGIFNSETNDPLAYTVVDFVAYEIVGSPLSKREQLTLLNNLGFNVARYQTFNGGVVDKDLSDYVVATKLTSRYELDGVVVEVDSNDKRAAIDKSRSVDNLNPRYAFKYKVQDKSNHAHGTVVGVDIVISKDGYLKPTIIIDPVDLVGVTVSRCTGYNMKYILENKIAPGVLINITRSGDVIPNCLGVHQHVDDCVFREFYENLMADVISDHGDFQWTPNHVDLKLTNPDGSSQVLKQRLIDFFNTVDVPFLGEGHITSLFDSGFTTIESILHIDPVDLNMVVGGSQLGKKISKSIKDKFTNVPLETLMGACSCFGRGVGVRKMKKLLEAASGNHEICRDFNAIVAVEGFDKKTATKIVNGYDEFLRFLADTSTVITIKPYQQASGGVLSGKTVVVTGFRDSEFEKRIEQLGGKIGSAISKTTSFVVAADITSVSSKLQKATSLSIPIMSKQEFISKFLG